MDKLPVELVYRIFALLEHRPLASAAKVCRTWRHLTGQAVLWKRLYEARWGPAKAAIARLPVSTSTSWKAAYEVQDRCDRTGGLSYSFPTRFSVFYWHAPHNVLSEPNTIFVREGDDYFLAQKGLLLRFLGSRKRQGSDCARGIAECSEVAGTTTSAPGLLDKMIQFVADVDHEHRRVTKRHQIDEHGRS